MTTSTFFDVVPCGTRWYYMNMWEKQIDCATWKEFHSRAEGTLLSIVVEKWSLYWVYFITVLLGLWGLSVVLGYRMMQRLKAEQRIHLQTEKKWNVSLHTFQRAKRPRLVFEHRMGFSERRIGNFSSSPYKSLLTLCGSYSISLKCSDGFFSMRIEINSYSYLDRNVCSVTML